MATKNPNTPSGKSSEKPIENETPEEFLKKVNKSFNDKQKINAGITKLQKAEVAKKLEASKAIEKKLSQMHNLLSKIPDDIKAKDNFLKPGESIINTNKKVIEKNIISNIKTSKKKVKVSLTNDEIDKLRGRYPGLKNIPHSEFDKHVFGTNNSTERNTEAYRQFPMLTDCAPKDSNACLSILDILTGNSTDPVVPSDNNSSGSTITNENEDRTATKDDIYKNVNSLLSELTPPEYAPVVEVKKRANETDVQNSVNAFQFKGGPADQPAFYDFYSLQIAFEHVWQEVFDQSIKDLIHQAYEEIVNSGIEPPPPPTNSTVQEVVNNIRRYAMAVENSKDEPPLNVAKVFKVTPQEWNELDANQKYELELNVANVVMEQQTNDKNSNVTHLIDHGKNMINWAGKKLNSNKQLPLLLSLLPLVDHLVIY